MITKKKRVFSGLQPTGKIHLGNYLGAISLWTENQDIYDNIFCIVDLHALTLPEKLDPKYLKSKIREIAGLYVACGIDPSKSNIFVQSHISEHAELAWILNCVTPIGWLERMTQFKSKSKQLQSVGTGLFNYPVLQAADILLYNTNLVPVGEDQKQHIELTRDIANRFNNLFKKTFVVPDVLIRKSGARIMGFDDPEQKMSKSIGEEKKEHAIGLLDPPNVIKKTVMRAVTDTNNCISFQDGSAGVLNLLSIYEVITKKSREDIENHFAGKGYGFLKKEIVDILVSELEPIQKRYNQLVNEKQYIDEILIKGAENVKETARSTYKRVKENLGIG